MNVLRKLWEARKPLCVVAVWVGFIKAHRGDSGLEEAWREVDGGWDGFWRVVAEIGMRDVIENGWLVKGDLVISAVLGLTEGERETKGAQVKTGRSRQI